MIVSWDEGGWSQQPPEEEGLWWWDGFGREQDGPTLYFVHKTGSGWWITQPFTGKTRNIPADGYWLGPIDPPVGPVNFGTATIDDEEE